MSQRRVNCHRILREIYAFPHLGHPRRSPRVMLYYFSVVDSVNVRATKERPIFDGHIIESRIIQGIFT